MESKAKEIEAIIQSKAEEVIPKKMWGLYLQERETLSADIRHKLEMIARATGQEKLNLDWQIEEQVKLWRKRKLLSFAYDRYKTVMGQLGKKPAPLAKFSQSERGRSQSPWNRFRTIEKRLLYPGVIVTRRDFDNKEIDQGTVTSIERNCWLVVTLDDGTEVPSTLPSSWDPIGD